MWESSLDAAYLRFDSSAESFMFPDSMNQSDSDFSTNKFAFPVNSSAKTRKTTKVTTQRKGKGAVSKRNTSNNRKSKTTVNSQATKKLPRKRCRPGKELSQESRCGFRQKCKRRENGC